MKKSGADGRRAGRVTLDRRQLLLSATAAVVSACTPPSLLRRWPRGAVESADLDSIADGFRSPPAAAKPHVWWHWMNGNVTREGIRADLEWMRRVGVGGVQNFEAIKLMKFAAS